jgi:hypothetical protein
VFVVHGTRRFLDRVRQPSASRDDRSTTVLGSWYATILFWKPHVALFVSETTLLPVLVALAPAASVIERFSTSLEDVLGRHGLSRAFIVAEVVQMTEHRLATTRNRSVVGVMNEFARLGAAYRIRRVSSTSAHCPCDFLRRRADRCRAGT